LARLKDNAANLPIEGPQIVGVSYAAKIARIKNKALKPCLVPGIDDNALYTKRDRQGGAACGGANERDLNCNLLALSASVASAQTPYDFWAQENDIRALRDDLGNRLQETPYSDFRTREKLQDQEFRLQAMERRNRDAYTDWLFEPLTRR
jgi:hypothetical protein